jgi:hypothetical protein
MFGPKPPPDPLPSVELEEVKRTLTMACPDHVCGDLTTPRPKCCCFHNAAAKVHEIQKILKEMHL